MTIFTYPCKQCGGKLEFDPGEHSLKCPYCGAANEIQAANWNVANEATKELDFNEYLSRQAGNEPLLEKQAVKCPSCGAQSQLAQNIVSDRCPFCATPLIVKDAYSHRSIRPKSIGPFQVKENDARSNFKKWIDGLWFAPNALKKTYYASNGLKALYIPFWTYDCKTVTPYIGERGDYYFDTEEYIENGERKTRQVQRISWRTVSGTVHVPFDDVLVSGSKSIPQELVDAISPWQLESLQAYDDTYVSGITVEAYQIGLASGFNEAKTRMDSEIENQIRLDIGGDQQTITNMNPSYSSITFKHILLPIWMSSYKYRDKTFRFLINGQSGKVEGERPYSIWKISGLAFLIVTVIFACILFYRNVSASATSSSSIMPQPTTYRWVGNQQALKNSAEDASATHRQ